MVCSASFSSTRHPPQQGLIIYSTKRRKKRSGFHLHDSSFVSTFKLKLKKIPYLKVGVLNPTGICLLLSTRLGDSGFGVQVTALPFFVSFLKNKISFPNKCDLQFSVTNSLFMFFFNYYSSWWILWLMRKYRIRGFSLSVEDRAPLSCEMPIWVWNTWSSIRIF